MDRHVAHVAHKIGPVQLERLVDEAIATFMPDLAEERRLAKADGRYFTVEQQQISYAGTAAVHGELDLADALDLEQAVAGLAAQLKELGSEDSLNVRRAAAVGELARHQLALALTDSRWLRRALRARLETTTPKRQVVLYVHLAAAALEGVGTARLEQGNQLVTAGQVRDWCGTAGKITVKPVLDLEAHDPVDTDVVPDRHAEVTAVRDKTCVFPWCTRSARRCDTDHTIPASRGGPTCPCNLAAVVQTTSPDQDPRRLDLHDPRTRRTISGPRSTATRTCVTPTAPSTSAATGLGHPTSYPAPDPAASGAIGAPGRRFGWQRDGCCATSSTTGG